MRFTIDTPSEHQLERELNLPRLVRRRKLPEIARGPVDDRRAEIRPVQQVEEFTPELHAGPFVDSKILLQVGVELEKARAVQGVASQVSERAADIRRTRHIGDFTDWKDHDSYQQALKLLLRDLKAETQKL